MNISKSPSRLPIPDFPNQQLSTRHTGLLKSAQCDTPESIERFKSDFTRMGIIDKFIDYFFNGGCLKRILQAAVACHIASFPAGRAYLAQRGTLEHIETEIQYLLEHLKPEVRQELLEHAAMDDAGMMFLAFKESGLRLPLFAESFGEQQGALNTFEANRIMQASRGKSATAPLLTGLATHEMDISAATAAIALLKKIAVSGQKGNLKAGQIYLKAATAIKASDQPVLANDIYAKAAQHFTAADEHLYAGNAQLIQARLCRQIDGNTEREKNLNDQAIVCFEQHADKYLQEGQTNCARDPVWALHCFQQVIEAGSAIARFNAEKCSHPEDEKVAQQMMREALQGQHAIKQAMHEQLQATATENDGKEEEQVELAKEIRKINAAIDDCAFRLKQLETQPMATNRAQRARWIRDPV